MPAKDTPRAARAPVKSTRRAAAAKAAAEAPARIPVGEPRQPAAYPIHQIYFLPEQLPVLDASFIALDNSASADPLHEFAVFERLALDEGLRTAPLWGALSWRFGKKTGLDGAALRQAIATHAGRDLYYCNPFPEHEALFINSWQQGVTSHPAFMALCTDVFEAAGLDAAELSAVRPAHSFSTCNYFIGSPAFWRLYLPWMRGVLDRARAGLPRSVAKVLDSPLGDPKNRHAGASYWPFIVERMLPLFLAGEGKGLRTHKLALPGPQARLNSHLLRLREMKDMAHRTRSRWLYACWLHYRNLYLLQTAGPEWCKRYLDQIGGSEPAFG